MLISAATSYASIAYKERKVSTPKNLHKVGGGNEDGVVMPAEPGASFEVVEAEFVMASSRSFG